MSNTTSRDCTDKANAILAEINSKMPELRLPSNIVSASDSSDHPLCDCCLDVIIRKFFGVITAKKRHNRCPEIESLSLMPVTLCERRNNGEIKLRIQFPGDPDKKATIIVNR